MTLQAPFHPQRFGLPRQRHLIDLAVAGRTPDSLVNVNTMIEIDKVRQIVHSRPLERLTGAITIPNRLEHGRYRPHLGVAVHTDLGGRNTGKGGRLYCRVTISAVDPQATRMMGVTEWYGLLSRNVLARFVRRLHDPISETRQTACSTDQSEQCQSRDGIGSPWKELRHTAP